MIGDPALDGPLPIVGHNDAMFILEKGHDVPSASLWFVQFFVLGASGIQSFKSFIEMRDFQQRPGLFLGELFRFELAPALLG